jgi:hypothetical protein
MMFKTLHIGRKIHFKLESIISLEIPFFTSKIFRNKPLQEQLHARSPLYTYTNKMFPNPKQKAKANTISRFRLQYQTRRDMFTALDEMNKLRAEGKLEKLIKIAEHELGVHYRIKSNNLMPRKKEFTVEICNLIGLAHLDRLKLPQSSLQLSTLEVLASIFDVSVVEGKANVSPYVFGDQSTYRDPGKPDTSFLVFKNNIQRLEERLKNTTMPIEKCHLYHEMGKQNLLQMKIDEARNFARKIIDVATHDAESYLWEFLGQILMVRADVRAKNFVKCDESLKAALKLVDVFANPALKHVISESVKVEKLL